MMSKNALYVLIKLTCLFVIGRAFKFRSKNAIQVKFKHYQLSQLYSLNAKWISVVLEDEKNPDTKKVPGDEKIMDKRDLPQLESPEPEPEPPKPDSPELKKIDDTKTMTLEGPQIATIQSTKETKKEVKIEPPVLKKPTLESPDKAKVSPSDSAPSEAFATKVVTSVVNSPTDDPDGIILKDIPVESKIMNSEDNLVNSDKEILKAQQAISKSFLSFGINDGLDKIRTENEIVSDEPEKEISQAKVAPTPASSPLENMFGFLKSDPNIVAAKPQEKTIKVSEPPKISKPQAESPRVQNAVSPKIDFERPTVGQRLDKPESKSVKGLNVFSLFKKEQTPPTFVEEKVKMTSDEKSIKQNKDSSKKFQLFDFFEPPSDNMNSKKIVSDSKLISQNNPTKTMPPKSIVTSINPKFQQSISKILKGETSKIKLFQKATDDFRSGSINSGEFLDIVKPFFGETDLEFVVSSLCKELPELDKSKSLNAAFVKFNKKEPTGLFGNLFKKASTPNVEIASSNSKIITKPQSNVLPKSPATRVSAPLKSDIKPSSIPTKQVQPSFKPKTPSGPIGTVSIGKVKIPTNIPIGKQIVVGQRLSSLIGGSLEPSSFYSFLVKELGEQIAKESLPAFYNQLPEIKVRKLKEIANKDI